MSFLYFGESCDCYFSETPIKPLENIFLILPEELFFEHILSCFDLKWLHQIGRLINRNINEFVCRGLRNYELKIPSFRSCCLLDYDSPNSYYGKRSSSIGAQSFEKCLDYGYFSMSVNSLVIEEQDLQNVGNANILEKFQTLEKLNVSGVDSIKRFFSKRTNLKTVKSLVWNSPRACDIICYLLKGSTFKWLKSLEIEGSRMDSDGISKLVAESTLKTLEKLTISSPCDINSGLMQLITSSNFSNLKYLNLRGTSVNDEIVNILSSCDFMVNLTYMNLSNTKVSNTSCLALSSSILSNLTELALENNNISVLGLSLLLHSKQLTSLRTLSISVSCSFGDEIVVGESKLETLILIGSTFNRQLAEMLNIPSLTHLNLNSTSLTDAHLQILSFHGLSNLRVLELDSNDVTDYGMVEFTTNTKSKQLVKLSARNNCIFGMETIEVIESNFPSLKKVLVE